MAEGLNKLPLGVLWLPVSVNELAVIGRNVTKQRVVSGHEPAWSRGAHTTSDWTIRNRKIFGYLKTGIRVVDEHF